MKQNPPNFHENFVDEGICKFRTIISCVATDKPSLIITNMQDKFASAIDVSARGISLTV